MKLVQRIYTPQESVNDQTLLVVGMNFSNGDFVKSGNVILELETSKAVTTIEAETDGYITYFCKTDDEVEVNALLAEIYDSAPESITPPPAKLPATPDKNMSEVQTSFVPQFSRKARELLRLHNLQESLFEQFAFVNEERVMTYLQQEQLENVQASTQPEKNNKKPEPLKNVVYEKLARQEKRNRVFICCL